MVNSAKKVCGSVRMEGIKTKNVWWNDMVNAVVKRKVTTWKELLEARDLVAKDRCMELYKEETREVRRCIYKSKKDANEQFGKMMNQNVE